MILFFVIAEQKATLENDATLQLFIEDPFKIETFIQRTANRKEIFAIYRKCKNNVMTQLEITHRSHGIIY